jgi:hypothetical protein
MSGPFGLPSGLPDLRHIFRPKKSVASLPERLAMEDVGIFYSHLVYFTTIWYILWPFGMYILWPFGMYILWPFGMYIYFVAIWYVYFVAIWYVYFVAIWYVYFVAIWWLHI